MLSEKLEILLFTYNRHELLDRTLRQLSESIFRQCKITVLDNCSTDETPLVCNRYSDLLPDLKVRRHEKNIGACANYLRAIELAEARYAWVICDDDFFDFTKVDDFVEVIENEKSDLVFVGTFDDLEIPQGVYTTTQDLVKTGARYFSIVLFVPSTVFRVELFDSKLIREGYQSISNLYCHFPFYNKMLSQNASVYVVENQMLRSGGNHVHGFSYFDLVLAQLNLFLSIEDKRSRHRTVQEVVFTKGFFSVAGHAILAKALYKSAFVFYRRIPFLKTISAMSCLSLVQKFAFSFGVVCMYTPVPVCRFMRRLYLRSHDDDPASENEEILAREQASRAGEI
jgi:glycosyltransferase involved in cell wall biosynthesis